MASRILITDFFLSAGGVLVDETSKKTLLIRQKLTNEYLLPKGTKEPGESILETATREVFEETGYKNIIPTEYDPLLAIFVRHHVGRSLGQHKVVFWYYTTLAEAKHYKNTQESWEDFEGEWCTNEESLDRLSFEEDKVIVQRAFEFPKANAGPTKFHFNPETQCYRGLLFPTIPIPKGFVIFGMEGNSSILVVSVGGKKCLPTLQNLDDALLLDILSKSVLPSQAPFAFEIIYSSGVYSILEWFVLEQNVQLQLPESKTGFAWLQVEEARSTLEEEEIKILEEALKNIIKH